MTKCWQCGSYYEEDLEACPYCGSKPCDCPDEEENDSISPVNSALDSTIDYGDSDKLLRQVTVLNVFLYIQTIFMIIAVLVGSIICFKDGRIFIGLLVLLGGPVEIVFFIYLAFSHTNMLDLIAGISKKVDKLLGKKE